MNPQTTSLRLGACALAAIMLAFTAFVGCTTAGSGNNARTSSYCGCCEDEPDKPANKPPSNVSKDGKADGGEEVCYLPPAAETDILTKLKVGQAAPAWALKDVRTGKEIKLSDFKGKRVLLKFWASWCPQCKRVGEERMKPIQQMLEENKRDDFLFIAVGTNFTDDTAASQRAELEVRGHNWLAVYDPDQVAVRAYGVDGIPAVILIDGAGKVVTFGLYKREFGDELDRYLRQECGAKP